jgi:hypothetical protein
MTSPTRRTRHGTTMVVSLALLLAAGCRDATSPARTKQVVGVRPHASPLAVSANDVPPAGMGLVVRDAPASPDRTRYRVEYHNGPLMYGTTSVYFIWYGNWSTDPEAPDPEQVLLPEFVSQLSGSPYFAISRLYQTPFGTRPDGTIALRHQAVDAYSHGNDLTDEDVRGIVRDQIASGRFPPDAGAVFVVLASADVYASPGLAESYCAYHGSVQPEGPVGFPMRYALIGAPARAPSQCAAQSVGPNGTLGADATASLLAAVLFNAVTDPDLNAWYDRLGYEGADKCVWTFGTTYAAANGALANVRLGARDYLLQQLWVPTRQGGKCALRS